jgi:hypothetical protein
MVHGLMLRIQTGLLVASSGVLLAITPYQLGPRYNVGMLPFINLLELDQMI